MPTITVTVSQERYDAMSVMPDTTPEEWLQHAADNKGRKMVDDLVTEYTDKNTKKITDAAKKAVISTIDLVAEKKKRKEGKY